MSIAKAERLSSRQKASYGVGDFGFALTDTAVGVLFAIFLTDVIGLAPGLAAIAILVGRTWDYINDPLVGYITDHTRSRWGRRRPFLLFGFLPFALGYAMMWTHPAIHSQVWLAAYYGLAYIVYDTCATFVYMPYFALTPELTQDYDERTNLTSFRMFFSITGTLVAFTVPLAIIGTMEPQNAMKVFLVGLGLGLASAIPLLIVFFGTRERAEYQTMEQPTIKETVRSLFGNRPFFFAMGVFLFSNTAFQVIQSIMLYFLKYRMGLESQSDYIMGTVLIMALVSLPLWIWASEHTEKRVAYIIGMVFFSIVMITLITVSPSWPIFIVYGLAALAGVGSGAMFVLPWSMIPDAIEYDQVKTGKRHEGTFYSLVTLSQKVASSIAIPLMLLALQWSGYQANSATQPASAVLAIRIMTGPVPSVFLVLGIVFALFYPLNRKRHAALRAELAARQADKTPSAE